MLTALLPVAAMAQMKQDVTVDGEKVAKTVQSITFNGADVVFHYSDGSDQSADMDNASIAIANTATAITSATAGAKKETSDAYDLSGRKVKDGSKGVIIRNGKKTAAGK